MAELPPTIRNVVALLDVNYFVPRVLAVFPPYLANPTPPTDRDEDLFYDVVRPIIRDCYRNEPGIVCRDIHRDRAQAACAGV